MKYKFLLITTVLLTLVTIMFYYSEVNPVIESDKKTNYFRTNALSINLETDSGVYEESTTNDWPQEGYVFNQELSRCEQDSEITWDDINKKVIIKSNKSDKCYVYFDKPILPVIKSVDFTNDGCKITISGVILEKNIEIQKYVITGYDVDNDAYLGEKLYDNLPITFDGKFAALSMEEEYLYVIDKNGNKSNLISLGGLEICGSPIIS